MLITLICKKNIHETTVYLETFIRNLLLNENNVLKNRYLHIDNLFSDPNSAIDAQIAEFGFEKRSIAHIISLFESVGCDKIFGRNDVSKICNISYSAAGTLISKLKLNQIIVEVKGYGKGKYKFDR